MNKDKQIEALTRYNNQYLDYLAGIEQKVDKTSRNIEKQIAYLNEKIDELDSRIDDIEYTLKQYHIT